MKYKEAMTRVVKMMKGLCFTVEALEVGSIDHRVLVDEIYDCAEVASCGFDPAIMESVKNRTSCCGLHDLISEIEEEGMSV